MRANLKPVDNPCGLVMALIPAYNAGEAVGVVVRDILALRAGITTVVVDDGSSDATARIARDAGALVISHPHNLGKGAALRTGFDHFLGTDLEAVVTLDADGQHSPREIPILVERWAATGADIIVGTRKRDVEKMPPLRIVTNTLSSLLVSLSAGTYIHDSQSGFRLLSRRVIENVKTTSRGYGAESEILIKAASRGYKVDSAPVSTIYGSEKSYIHPLKQPLRFLGLMVKSIFWRFERSDGKQSH
jgi:glycosyltransferase involved in cell wall biosynthesis